MTKTIDFYHDLASPNAYFSNRVLPGIAKKHGAEINYIPVLLGGVFKATNNQAPWMAFGNIKEKMSYMQIEIQRFIKKHGLTKYKLNPHFPINTITLARAEIAAKEAGFVAEYIKAGEELMWEDGLNMGDKEVFVDGFNGKGLDGAWLLEQTQRPEIKAKLFENTEAAVKRGVFGIPTFFVGDEIYFGKDTLRDVEDELAS